MEIFSKLRQAPFSLDEQALAWVRQTHAQLSLEEKISQVFVLALHGKDPALFERYAAMKLGGVTRFYSPDLEFEMEQLQKLIDANPVPMVITADMEGSRHSFAFGTPVLGQLGLAAVDDEAATKTSAAILAQEGRAMGVTWSFTPVIDVNAAFRSAIVGTRSFGSNVETVERHAVAHIRGLQENGIAATAKHWPGEGFDDRDQHLVTTVIPLGVDEWMETFGRLYKRMFDEGVMSVMSAHIAFPAYIRSKVDDPGIEAFRPACVSKLLTTTLLREELGFNGIIVSDATEMGGLEAWGDHMTTKPELLAAGCDVILFTSTPEDDMAAVRAAIEKGTLTEARLDEAVIRLLALKAKLGLFKPVDVLPGLDRAKAALAKPENITLSKGYIARSPTLVKDVQGLFPLSPEKHRRILLTQTGIIHPLIPRPLEFVLPDLLRREGFDVTIDTPEIVPRREDFDLLLYAFGEESLLVRNHIFLDWHRMSGGALRKTMARPWTSIPTAMISFGHPYYLYDAPRVPAYINAYSTMDSVQEAVVDCMMGRKPFNLKSPVDAFCGLEDAHY